MKKILMVICLVIMLVFPSVIFAAGSSVTATRTKIDVPFSRAGIHKVVVSWVADDTSHLIPSTTLSTALAGYGGTSQLLGLCCFLGETIPGAVTVPTDDYDINITDEYGVDVFGGNLENRDETNAEQAIPLVGTGVGSRLLAGEWTIAVTGTTVNSATGTLVLYFMTCE